LEHHSLLSNGDVAIALVYGLPMLAPQQIDHPAGVYLKSAELEVASNDDAFGRWGKMHQNGRQIQGK
jgi:hypothetical protein